MKTIREWLEELPSPIREQALVNVNDYVLAVPVINLDQALLTMFTWGDSSEGDEYWRKIYDSLPILPIPPPPHLPLDTIE